jgi:hypothetical protein
MPTDFGEIADYHRHQAERFRKQEQQAREQGDLGRAEYLAGQVARYLETAEQQKMVKVQPPGPSILHRRHRAWPPEPQQRLSWGESVLLALLHGTERIAALLRRKLPKQHEAIQDLPTH